MGRHLESISCRTSRHSKGPREGSDSQAMRQQRSRLTVDNAHMAGKRHKLRSDPAHVASHAAGASVTVIQLLEHDPFGTIAFPWQANTWAHHYEATAEAAERLKALSGEILAVPADSTGTRVLSDEHLVRAIYLAGTSGLINAFLTVQHFCERLEAIADVPNHEGPIKERLGVCKQVIGLDATEHPRYWALAEITRVRNAVEHPHRDTSYSGENGDWDRVPLAWMISNRGVATLKAFLDWFEFLADRLLEFEMVRPPQSMMLNLGMRGMVSDVSPKKPLRGLES